VSLQGSGAQGAQADLTRERQLSAPSPNPFAGSTNVTISVPESVDIRLVDASTLADLAIWSLLTSIFSSAVVGFLVAFVQADPGKGGHHLTIAIVFALTMLFTGVMMFFKGRRLYQKARKVSFRLGPAVEEPSEFTQPRKFS
jgi:hypothetical protein